MNTYHNNQENAKLIMELANELANEGNLAKSINERLGVENGLVIVADLKEGIDTFDTMYEDVLVTGAKPAIEETINEALEEMLEEERIPALEAIVRALGGNPEGLSPESLKTAAVIYIDEFAIMNLRLDEGLAEALEGLGAFAANEISAIALQSSSRQYVAAAMYILYSQGQFPELSDELSPKAFGVDAAAAVLIDKTIRGGAEGNIPWEKVKEILKLIAAIAATILISIALSHISVIIALQLVPMYFSSFGLVYALVLTALSGLSIAAFGGFNKLNSQLDEFTAPGIEVIKEQWEKLLAWIKAEISPEAKEFWEKTKETAKEKANEAKDIAKEKASEAKDMVSKVAEEMKNAMNMKDEASSEQSDDSDDADSEDIDLGGAEDLQDSSDSDDDIEVEIYQEVQDDSDEDNSDEDSSDEEGQDNREPVLA